MDSYANIKPIAPRWLWRGKVPEGGVIIVAGEGGIGKGHVVTDLIARITRGDVMLDGSPGIPAANVITITPEDDPQSVMGPRLAAAGADVTRVLDLTEDEDGNPFTLPDDVGRLRDAVESADAALVVVDPLAACVAGSLSTNLAVRRMLGPLTRMARETGCSVILVHHVVKAGTVAGSRGLTDTVRMVLTVSRDPGDPRIRQLAVSKCNLAADSAEPVRFTIVPAESGSSTAITWLPTIGQATSGAGPNAVLAVLAGRTMTGRQVADAAGISYPAARVILHRLTRSGAVDNPARGLYRVA